MKNNIFNRRMIRKTMILLSVLVVIFVAACSKGTKGSEQIENISFGMINVSVANLYAAPDYAAEITTQLLLGAPIRILKHDGDWYQVKTTEKYVSWIPGDVFVKIDNDTFKKYQNEKKIIFTDDYGFAYESTDSEKQRSSDLVFGCILKWKADAGNYYQVSYPDGRNAYVPKSHADLFDHWLSTCQMNADSIVKTALTLKGIPYMWGGTSVKGLDCSGFSKTVFLKHGVILLRDASQQATTGIPVDISNGYDHLQTGDLMFFGRKATKDKKEKVSHVAIYVGNKKFIHAIGYIHLSSLDPESPIYDEGNTRRFIRAARIVGAVGTKGIKSMADYYTIDKKN